jgi:adenosine deaminase
VDDFIARLPKAELHLHIEGTLEPEMMFELSARNGVGIPFSSVDQIRAAYEFTDLQSFLDIYYEGAAVLRTADDFRDLMWAYLQRAAADGVRHAEMFFDPQTHTERGIGFEVFMEGFAGATKRAAAELGMTSLLIMCFLRHLPEAAAIDTFEEARPFLDQIAAVGLDSSEVGHPPEEFERVFALARDAGLRVVAHAGEEGPPSYIYGALDTLHVERIDHGVACEQDDGLVERLATEGIPLTMCPLSNVRLKGFARIEDHNLKRLMDRGVKVTVNSDDPSYFGGYVADNYRALQDGLDLTDADLAQLARNSIEASFLEEAAKRDLIAELDEIAASSR